MLDLFEIDHGGRGIGQLGQKKALGAVDRDPQGVLVDHLVAGSKEARIADEVRRGAGGDDTLVVGHPYVDIWQAVKPQRLGLTAWPQVPRHLEWKHGACKALGLPHATQADIARAWQHIRSRVRDWNDLEPALIGRVEELIDFVTQPVES